MLELDNQQEQTYVDATISISTTFERIVPLLNKIHDLIHSYAWVEVVVGTDCGLLKYNFDRGVATRYPESENGEVYEELNKLMRLHEYIGKQTFKRIIPVNTFNISAEDQYRHIQHWLDTFDQPLYVTLGTAVVHNREHWERALIVKPSEIQGRIVKAILLDNNRLECVVEFSTTEKVKEILTQSPQILSGLYAMIEGRCVKLMRMHVRSMYTHEREKLECV